MSCPFSARKCSDAVLWSPVTRRLFIRQARWRCDGLLTREMTSSLHRTSALAARQVISLILNWTGPSSWSYSEVFSAIQRALVNRPVVVEPFICGAIPVRCQNGTVTPFECAHDGKKCLTLHIHGVIHGVSTAAFCLSLISGESHQNGLHPSMYTRDIRQIKLCENGRDLLLYPLHTEHQLVSNTLIRVPLSHVLQHCALPPAEPRKRLFRLAPTHQIRKSLRIHETSTRSHRLNHTRKNPRLSNPILHKIPRPRPSVTHPSNAIDSEIRRKQQDTNP